jgi:hypothetical protein
MFQLYLLHLECILPQRRNDFFPFYFLMSERHRPWFSSMIFFDSGRCFHT